ncbi:uncharacterized protein B0H18DRAFT_425772 [Fomitopsis serialis]|uniref:uncharacterized protein n=1 Tax=Fomitopsis serialis TaxID=139415 RepID=UPI002008D56E|nr:uncharacterized protein B0H18DRAFT_425772 [Neoantrodia serialis]KAH9924550.1 hypothetical protein B0H18DRAFT_425772 [Neoantrodia serialis]
MPSSHRSRSLSPDAVNTSRTASGKQRSSSVPATRPQLPLRGILRPTIADANHHAVSPVRGILKKPTPQAQASKSSSASSALGAQIKHDDPAISQRSTTDRSRPHSSSDPAPHTRTPDSAIRPRSTSHTNAEEDYVARACGHLPPFPEHHRHRPRSSTVPSVPSRLAGQSSDGSDTEGKHARQTRGRATSAAVRKSAPFSKSNSPSPEKRDADQTSKLVGKKGSPVPRLPFQIADHKDVMNDLTQLLHERQERLADYLDLRVFGEQKKFEREAREHFLKHKDDPPEQEENPDGKPPRIYHMSVLEMMEVSSTTIVMNGYQHDLPAVIYECVEELYRTGIYDANLFRGTPIKHNIDKMRRMFDHGYKRPLGVRIGPLARSSTADICGLFETILEHLPEPLIPQDLNYGLWKWCVNPVLKREWDIIFPPVTKRTRKTLRGTIPEMEHEIIEPASLTPTERRAIREAFDAPLIEIAQHVLRLLPVERLSLLVYLFDFFKQVLAYTGNGISAEVIGEKFGFYLLGGASYAAGRTLAVWMLDRWERLSKGLLDVAPPGTRRFVTQKPDLARRRAEEAHRRRYAPSPHQPYQEGYDACADAGSGSSASSDTTSTSFGSSVDGRDDDEAASVLGYYLGEHPRSDECPCKPRHDVGEDSRVYTPKPEPRRRSPSRNDGDIHRFSRFGDESNVVSLVDASRRIAELERELQQSNSFRRLLRREAKPSRKHREELDQDQDCDDDYSHYF